ncbi:carph-isopro domain-containing protein [Pelagibacterium flavum]|uniref:carph-isopro domain-containing protein n=1 Tax=Pelagibacterium flavum TaxID=2984530 RepID=UPI0038CD5F29
MEPASTIITKLGGPNAVAEITGVHRTRVSNWKRSKAVGGTGGTIPFNHVPKLLDAARERGIPLSADDFLPAPKEESAA